MSTSVLTASPRTTPRLQADNDVVGPSVIPRSRRPPVPRWASLVGVVVLWQLASAAKFLSPDLLAPPSTIATTGWRLVRSGELGSALLVSSGRLALGLAWA